MYTHTPTQRHQPLSSSTENVYRQLSHAQQHIHSTETVPHRNPSLGGHHRAPQVSTNTRTRTSKSPVRQPISLPSVSPSQLHLSCLDQSLNLEAPPDPHRFLPLEEGRTLSLARTRVGGRGRIWEQVSQLNAKGCGAVGEPGLEGFFKKEEGRG